MKLIKFCEVNYFTDLKTEKQETRITILNQNLWKQLHLPMQITSGTETTTIEKDFLLCDSCNAVNPEWALIDGDYISEALCEKCKLKYFKKTKVVKE